MSSNPEKLILSSDLVDQMVDALTELPFRRVAAIFDQLGVEVQQGQEAEEPSPEIFTH